MIIGSQQTDRYYKWSSDATVYDRWIDNYRFSIHTITM